MPVYSISYDLSTPGQKYQCIEEKIKAHCSGYCMYAESAWIVKYSGNANTLSDILLKCLDKNDRILVIKVVNDKQGWLNQNQWDTINGFFE